MGNMTILLIALLLDALVGEPEQIWSRIPHPAVAMGRLISWTDDRFNRGERRKELGLASLAAGCVLMAAIGSVVAAVPDFGLLELLVTAALLSHRSLVDHVQSVAKGLQNGVPEGRSAVANIVGRDTSELNESGVARAAIESAAENFSDGVVAPAFWFVLLGLPGLLVYKFVNTADSMIGYRNEKYRDFGWATARFDDLLNAIPARISGLLIAASQFSVDAVKVMWRDARKHRSPNAGWPEAAMAAVLGVTLSGPRSYHGTSQDFPFIHPEGRIHLSHLDVEFSVAVLWHSWVAGFVIVFVCAALGMF